jgi:hypothetical protein
MIGDHRCFKIECPDGYYQDTSRPNRCNKRLIKQVYNQQTQKVSFDSEQQPNYITYNHLTFACNLTATGERPFYEFNFESSSEVYEFKLDLVDVKTRPTRRPGTSYVEPARLENFEVRRKGRNGASVHLVKPLAGPQDVDLSFKVVDGEGEVYYNAKISIYVSEYYGFNF